MHGEAVWQNGRAAKLKQWKGVDHTGLEIGVKDTAIRADGLSFQGQVAKDIFAVQFRDRGAAINKTSGDGDAVVVVVFECAPRAANRVNQARWTSGAVISGRRADGAGRSGRAVGAVEAEGHFLAR